MRDRSFDRCLRSITVLFYFILFPFLFIFPSVFFSNRTIDQGKKESKDPWREISQSLLPINYHSLLFHPFPIFYFSSFLSLFFLIEPSIKGKRNRRILGKRSREIDNTGLAINKCCFFVIKRECRGFFGGTKCKFFFSCFHAVKSRISRVLLVP